VKPNPPRDDATGSGEAWTQDRIRALGAVTDVPTAASIFNIGRSTAYELVQMDAFPVPVLRIGSRYRVPVAAILAVLHMQADDGAEEPHPAT
jgi:predicted DNA-binding transcriptional regulator AlpA